MKIAIVILPLLLIAGCAKSRPPYAGAEGELAGPCRKDGTCTGRLVCMAALHDEYVDSLHMSNYVHFNWCQLPQPSAGCHGDADCFCKNCLERCGNAGMKRCVFGNDTWGAGPDVCECVTEVSR